MAKSSHSEYFPTEAEQQAADPAVIDEKDNDNFLAPMARKLCRRSKHLSDGAKVLYDELTDLSFIKRLKLADGVLQISKSLIARELKKSFKTIHRRAIELESKGWIVTRTQFIGGYEVTVWVIKKLANGQQELFPTADPRFGTSGPLERKERRHQPLRGKDLGLTGRKAGAFVKVPENGNGNGHLRPDGQSCPPGQNPSESTESPTKSGVFGQDCPSPSDKVDRGARSKLTVEHGQGCPKSTVKVDRGARSELTEEHGQSCPESTVKVVRGAGSELSDIRSLETVDQSVKSLSKRLGNRAGAATFRSGPPIIESVNDFMLACEDIFGPKEWRQGGPEGKGNGGLWRTLYNQDATMAVKCLLQTREDKIGGRIKKNPAAHCMDLWVNNRLGPKKERKVV